MVVSEPLVDRLREIKQFNDGAGAALMQSAIADFIEDGYFQAHLRRMRAVYRDKRDRLLQLIREGRVPVAVQPRPAGMHVTMMLADGASDVEIAERMGEQGFETPALSKHYLRQSQARQGLLAGFTSASDADLAAFAGSLAAVIGR